MSAKFVQVAPDSTGKKVQTFENVIGSDTVEAQAVVLVDPAGVATTARTPVISIETDSSNSPVAAGKKSVAFIFSSDFVGTIQTKAISVASLGFEAHYGDTLSAIAYEVSAGSVTIITLV